MSLTAAGRGRPLDSSRDPAILSAALELVAEVGYERVTMDAIAARCRAGKATIYRRWDSKASLISDAMREHKRDIACLPDTGSIRGDLLAGLQGMVEYFTGENLKLVAGLLTASQNDPELARLLSENILIESRRATQEWLARSLARGQLLRASGAEVIHQIAPSVIFMRLLITGEPVDEDFRVYLVDNILMPLLTCRPAGVCTGEDLPSVSRSTLSSSPLPTPAALAAPMHYPPVRPQNLDTSPETDTRDVINR